MNQPTPTNKHFPSIIWYYFKIRPINEYLCTLIIYSSLLSLSLLLSDYDHITSHDEPTTTTTTKDEVTPKQRKPPSIWLLSGCSTTNEKHNQPTTTKKLTTWSTPTNNKSGWSWCSAQSGNNQNKITLFLFVLILNRRNKQNRQLQQVTAYQINNSFRRFFHFFATDTVTRAGSSTLTRSWVGRSFIFTCNRLTKFATVVDTRREAKAYKV